MSAARIRVAHRDAVRVYVWQHLRAHPESWFTAYELARVAVRYGDPETPEGDRPRWAWRKPVIAVLRDMADAGEVARRPRVDEHVTGPGCMEWRSTDPVVVPVLYPEPPLRHYVASLPIPTHRPLLATRGGAA